MRHLQTYRCLYMYMYLHVHCTQGLLYGGARGAFAIPPLPSTQYLEFGSCYTCISHDQHLKKTSVSHCFSDPPLNFIVIHLQPPSQQQILRQAIWGGTNCYMLGMNQLEHHTGNNSHRSRQKLIIKYIRLNTCKLLTYY